MPQSLVQKCLFLVKYSKYFPIFCYCFFHCYKISVCRHLHNWSSLQSQIFLFFVTFSCTNNHLLSVRLLLFPYTSSNRMVELDMLRLWATSNWRLTWLYWIFDAEHGWPVSIPHGFEHLLLGQVGSSILHPNARFHVVEIAAVQLEELN